jgi:hypothetical protein
MTEIKHVRRIVGAPSDRAGEPVSGMEIYRVFKAIPGLSTNCNSD